MMTMILMPGPSTSTPATRGGADNWGRMEKLYAEDSIFIDGNPDNFGASVAIDGDYAIIGAPGADNSSIDSGYPVVKKF